jgi:taurine transport system substrate-binding protein
VDGYFESLRNDPAAWTAGSDNVKLIARLQGGTPEENAGRLRQTRTIPLQEQTSAAWLGGGDQGGVAKVLADTAQFLKEQHKITRVQASYGAFATPAFAEGSAKLVN